VCYDLRFPELTRRAFYQRADLLVVPAEWPSARGAILELLTRARAAENQCWVLSCNRAGALVFAGEDVAFPGTALLADPLGRVAARSEGGELLVGEVDHALTRETRRRIPCASDLARAGLGPQ
jgi:predicted amidohydrolase